MYPPVPRWIRVAEAPGRGKSVLSHAPSSKAAEAYRQLAKAIFNCARTQRERIKSTVAAAKRRLVIGALAPLSSLSGHVDMARANDSVRSGGQARALRGSRVRAAGATQAWPPA